MSEYEDHDLILPLPPSASPREWTIYCKKLEDENKRLMAEIRLLRGFLGSARNTINLALADYPGNSFTNVPGRDDNGSV